MFDIDNQLKRGLLDACVLAVLNRGDSYGYKMIKDVGECVEISESTLYPILKRLEATESVTVFSVDHNGRLRKYYQITDKGRKRLSEFITDWEQVMKVYKFIAHKGDEI